MLLIFYTEKACCLRFGIELEAGEGHQVMILNLAGNQGGEAILRAMVKSDRGAKPLDHEQRLGGVLGSTGAFFVDDEQMLLVRAEGVGMERAPVIVG